MNQQDTKRDALRSLVFAGLDNNDSEKAGVRLADLLCEMDESVPEALEVALHIWKERQLPYCS